MKHNTKKIRIGNDIRLAVDLRQYLTDHNLRERDVYNPSAKDFNNVDGNPFVNKIYEVYHPGCYADHDVDNIYFKPQPTAISIRSVKAILINTTMQRNFAKIMRHKSRFISRFPIEPALEAFHSTPYDICGSGYHTWRTYPRPYMMAPFHGFGLHPRWTGIYKPLPMINDIEYRANVSATDHQNVVEVSFPAEHQLHTGVYKLIIVAKIYAPGFNNKNLKTITVDVPDVFELVKTSEEGRDGDVVVNVMNLRDRLPDGERYEYTSPDIYVNQGTVDADENMIQLGRTDEDIVNVDMTSLTGWLDADAEPQEEL